MSRGTLLFVGAAVVAVLSLGRVFPSPAGEPDADVFVPPQRVVDEIPAVDWEPASEVRDPFLPLLLPDAAAQIDADAAPGEAGAG